MAGSVPQRVRPGDSRPNIGFDRAGPARREPATYLNMGDRTYNQPGFERPMTNVPVGSPNIGRDRMGGIFGGQGASGANDMVNAMLGGMNTSRLWGGPQWPPRPGDPFPPPFPDPFPPPFPDPSEPPWGGPFDVAGLSDMSTTDRNRTIQLIWKNLNDPNHPLGQGGTGIQPAGDELLRIFDQLMAS